MSVSKGEIPALDSTNIVYAHPYQTSMYELTDFEINFEDFILETNKNHSENLIDDDQGSLEENELKEKISKIQELIRLKELEKNYLIEKEMSKEYQESYKFWHYATEIISELNNYAAELSSILLNYGTKKRLALLQKLDETFNKQDLNITGENENARCEEVGSYLTSLKPYKKKKH